MNNNLKYYFAFGSATISLIFFSVDFLSSLGIAIFIFFSTKFFLEIGEKIEIRDIIIIIAVLQWIIGPLLTYFFFPDDDIYYMAVPLETYTSFVVPASYALVIGLYFPIKISNTNENLILKNILEFRKKYENLEIYFIIIGVILDLIVLKIPISFRFFIALLSDIRFIGLFLLIIGNRKYKWFYVSIVILLLLINSLRQAMFHDLLLWLSFFIVIFAFIKKPSFRTKLLSLVLLLSLAIIIQTVKYTFRQKLNEGEGVGIELFTNIVKQEVVESNYITSENNLSAMVLRINQGWIIARIMAWVPRYEPYAKGETIKTAINAALIPRFLKPDKVKAGGRTYFKRFTGKNISETTSMGLGLLGEAYANYGINGTIIFMFTIGLFYNIYLKMIYKISQKHPVIILFIPLIFLQVVKAEVDFSVIINHLVKSTIVVWLIFFLLRRLNVKI